MTRSALETVQLYIEHTSNRGDESWVPRLCADPVRRHDPNKITDMSHAMQMTRFRESKLRPLEPFFTDVLLTAQGEYVTWIWNMALRKGEMAVCGIEVFKVQDGLITDVWNTSYMEGAWPALD